MTQDTAVLFRPEAFILAADPGSKLQASGQHGMRLQTRLLDFFKTLFHELTSPLVKPQAAPKALFVFIY